MSDAREATLGRLRQALSTGSSGQARPPFPHPRPFPSHRQPVTQVVGDRGEWMARFGEEIERLGGTWEYVETVAAARLSLLARFQTEHIRQVLAWDPGLWPLPGLYDALSTVGVDVIVPDFRLGDRVDVLRQAAEVDLGITSAEAALASTGTLVVRSGLGFSRLASLITPRHLALVPVSRLYPNLEMWLSDLQMAGRAKEFFTGASNVTLISGPSRTADIEMTLILGVHGPRQVNVLFFEER